MVCALSTAFVHRLAADGSLFFNSGPKDADIRWLEMIVEIKQKRILSPSPCPSIAQPPKCDPFDLLMMPLKDYEELRIIVGLLI